MGGGSLQGIRSMGRNNTNGVWSQLGPQCGPMEAMTSKGPKISPLGSEGTEPGLKYSTEIKLINDVF